jgi:hypothetical protein
VSRKYFVCAVILVAVLAGGFWGYRFHARRQPAYSLSRIVAACQERDAMQFQQYVDLDAVLAQAMAELQHKVLPGGDAAGAELQQFGAALGQTVMQLVAPGLLQRIKSGVLTAVGSGQLAFLRLCEKDLFGNAETKSCNIVLNSVAKTDNLARIDATVTQPSGEHSLRFLLRLEPRDGYWQVVSVENMQELLVNAPLLLER